MAMATAAENVENKVCLIREHTEQINSDPARLTFFSNDMTLSGWEPPLDTQSGLGAALSTHIKRLKSKCNLSLIEISIYSPKRIFRISFTKSFVENLCRVLPHPFFQIEGWIDESSGSGGDHSFSKRFGLHDILTSGTRNGVQSLEGYFCAAERCGKGRCTFSIMVGWIAPPPTPNKVIQLSPGSMSQSLLENEATMDLTLVAANGAEIKCHKVMFSAQSPVLTAMVTNGLKECEEGRVDFTENSENGLHLLRRYLYGFALVTKDISPELMVELFQTAHKYDLAHLQKALLQILLEKDEKWFSPDTLLELYFYARNVDEFEKLRDHALLLTTRIKTEVFRSCEGFRKLDPAVAFELLGEQIKLFQEGIAK